MNAEYKSLYEKFGLNVVYYRKLRKMTQLQLAELVEIDRSHISAIELGNVPDIKVLASAYGIQSLTLSGNDKIESAVDEMLKCRGAFILECMVSPDISSVWEDE